jgi:perosamine synthetase
MKKINQTEPWIGDEEKKAVQAYLDSGGWLMEYEKTEELERMIADYTKARYAIMVDNGTNALVAALYAYGIGKGDEVIIPDYTMVATANACYLCGANPVFVDIERKSLGIDFDDMKKKITEKTKAVMLVSINGRYPIHTDEIIDYCKDENIIIIEDAAQSLGSFHNGRHIGTFGNVGSFSFSMPKIITSGNGGALITKDRKIYERIKMIKNFGRRKGGGHNHEMIGFNFKYTDLQSVILIEQMKKLKWRVNRKREIYWFYEHYLKEIDGVKLIETNLNEATPWFNDILVRDRDKLKSFLDEKGIGTKPFYPAIHTLPPYKWVKGNFETSISVSDHGLWLPSASFLKDEEVEYICNMIKEGIKK